MNEIYRTEFENKRSESVEVLDGYKRLAVLKPGEKGAVESWSPRTLYAPFSRVTYLPNGRVDLKKNRLWSDPVEGWSIELNNEDGAPVEAIRLGDNFVKAVRGIPCVVPCPLYSPEIWNKRISWLRKRESVPSQEFPDYLISRLVLKIVREPRTKTELGMIRAEIEKREREKTREKVESLIPPEMK
jgi:hypothetical protein